MKIKNAALLQFYRCFMQYQFSDADSDCFIMGRSLCQSLLTVKVSSSGLKFSTDRCESVGLEEATPQRLWFS